MVSDRSHGHYSHGAPAVPTVQAPPVAPWPVFPGNIRSMFGV